MKRTRRILAALLLFALCLAVCAPCLAAAEPELPDPQSLVNIYDKNAVETGWFAADGSAVGTSQKGSTTDPITVHGNGLLTFGPIGKTQEHVLHVYDANGNVLVGNVKAADLTVVDNDFIDFNIFSYRLPENAAAVRFLVPATVLHTFLVTENQAFDAESYDRYWNADASRARYVRNYGQHFEHRTDSVLYQKSALFLGDSLCMAKPAGFYYYGWAGRIGEIHDMDYLNAGQSGTAFSNKSHYGRILEQFYMSDKLDYDYVILEGGINDAWFEADVGTMTEGFDDPFDPSTFAGGFEETIKIMKERYPNAQYGHIIHYETPDAPYGRIPQAASYVEMAKKICEKWEIPYLDLFNDRELCYEVIKVDTLTNMYDDVHVNVHGYDLLHPVIESWMERLGQPDLPADDGNEEGNENPDNEENQEGDKNEQPETPETPATPDDTTAPTGGCGSTLSLPAAVLMTVGFGLCLPLVKKKQEK